MGSYVWKWIPLEQVIFMTAPFRAVSVISLIIPSAISDGLQTNSQCLSNTCTHLRTFQTPPLPQACRNKLCPPVST